MEYLSEFWQEYWMLAILVLCLISFFAGFVDSIAGGGGLFLVPGFLIVGLPPQVALGQEKIVSTLGTIAAIRNFLKESKMLWKVAILGVPFSLAGAYLGAHLILLIPAEIVAKLLLILIPIGIVLFLIPKDKEVTQKPVSGRLFYLMVPLICFVVGFYDGFFGPGTGSMFIIAFHYLLKLDLVSSSANSKSFNFASNIGALVAFVMAGKVIYQMALPLVISNIIGNHFGSKLAVSNGSAFVRKVLVFSMLTLFSSLAVKYAI
ncbi:MULTISPECIES: sulfite exporter TauE/SafE family protein [Deefgea]|nr:MULTISPECIES: TSUP family transporter [Deefgea]MBM9890234.1 TSUP family transporter [Deefgea sp. CFH1-16]